MFHFLKRHSINQSDTLPLQTHHVYSTLKQRGNDCFHVLLTLNTRGVYSADTIYLQSADAIYCKGNILLAEINVQLGFVPTSLTCLRAFHAYVPICLRASKLYVPTCLRALYVKLRAYVPCVFHLPSCLST